MAYGDSLTAGYYNGGRCFAPYANELAKQISRTVAVEVWANGLSGLQASELTRHSKAQWIEDATHRFGPGVEWILENEEPFDVVIIMAGTNDIGDEPPELIFGNIKLLHTACHERSIRTVVLSVPQNSFSQSKMIEDENFVNSWEETNRLLRCWAEVTDDVSLFFDFNDIMSLDDQSPFWDAYEKDLKLHFSPEGSREIGKQLAVRLLPLLSEPETNVIKNTSEVSIED